MGKSDHKGNRKGREFAQKRVPDLGYYIIVTDTNATESNYFYGLKNSLPKNLQDRIVIKVIKAKTDELVDNAKLQASFVPQYGEPWIVFDRDEVQHFDDIIAKADSENVKVGWSNPCFEVWLFGYFGNMPAIQESWVCCNRFSDLFKRKVGHGYVKSDKNIYNKLCKFGDEKMVIKIAAEEYEQAIREGKTVPSQMCPSSRVYELVSEIKNKCDK